eukprot:1192520-Prorocentrum_minimum.AAC.2
MLAPTSDRESSRTGGEDAKERPPVRVVDCAGLGSGVEALVDLGVVDRAGLGLGVEAFVNLGGRLCGPWLIRVVDRAGLGLGVEALVDPGVVDRAGLGLGVEALVDPGGRLCGNHPALTWHRWSVSLPTLSSWGPWSIG